MAQWLWRLQSDTLGLSPIVAGFSLSSFLPASRLGSNETYSYNYPCRWSPRSLEFIITVIVMHHSTHNYAYTHS